VLDKLVRGWQTPAEAFNYNVCDEFRVDDDIEYAAVQSMLHKHRNSLRIIDLHISKAACPDGDMGDVSDFTALEQLTFTFSPDSIPNGEMSTVLGLLAPTLEKFTWRVVTESRRHGRTDPAWFGDGAVKWLRKLAEEAYNRGVPLKEICVKRSSWLAVGEEVGEASNQSMRHAVEELRTATMHLGIRVTFEHDIQQEAKRYSKSVREIWKD
jgi:hypothetical protein